MPSKLPAIVALLSVLVLPAAGFVGLEIHRARVAIEETRDLERGTQELIASLKPTPQPAKCPATVSHLPRDVDLGIPHECSDAPGVTCVTYDGKDMTAQVAEARCKAGKF